MSKSYRQELKGIDDKPRSECGLVLTGSFIYEIFARKVCGAEAGMNFSRSLPAGRGSARIRAPNSQIDYGERVGGKLLKV